MSVVTILPEPSGKYPKANTTTTPSAMNPSRNSVKSMETLYSTSSSKFSMLNRRKGSQRNRVPGLVPAVSEIKQRVMSARLLRMKQLQNQVGEAHHRLSELAAENRLLKSLHKRQDSALSKYENSSAELPKLLHSHAEEVRVWQTRCRNIQRQNKELMNKIKQKDTMILTITDQNKHLLQLNKDKNLEEREHLADRVRDLEQRLLDKDNDLKLLSRRLQLEAKSYKTNLNIEQQKYRDLLNKIEMADFMIPRADIIGDKKSPKPGAKNPRSKSPSNRTKVTKSATSLTNGHHEGSSTPTLPPCEGQIDIKKQPVESVKVNSPKVNANVRLLPDSHSVDDEVDLTRNRLDMSENFLKNGSNSFNDDDEITVTVRNGMNRARYQQKSTKIPTTKLTPLHNKPDAKKSSDSEFSEDDFHFFSEHNNDTNKMALNARDLLEHKMHLEELEAKMKQNSLEPTLTSPMHQHHHKLDSSNAKAHSSSESSSNGNGEHLPIAAFDDIPIHSFNNNRKREDIEVANIEREIHESMMRRESLLDDYCETIDKQSCYSKATTTTITKVKKLELTNNANNSNTTGDNAQTTKNNAYRYGKSNGSVISGKSTTIDPNKKSKLLAALKNIENESFDNN